MMPSKPTRGVLCGLVLGAFGVLTLLAQDFPDKNAVLFSAFLNRFAIGLVVGCVSLNLPGWGIGLLFGTLLSLPEAILTGAFLPVLGVGAGGGALVGTIVHAK